MSEPVGRPSIEPMVEFVMIFEKSGVLANQRHVYLVQGAIGPPPHGTCGNVSRLDEKVGQYEKTEFVSVESGGLTELFKKVESELSKRHPGCSKAITFHFETKAQWIPLK